VLLAATRDGYRSPMPELQLDAQAAAQLLDGTPRPLTRRRGSRARRRARAGRRADTRHLDRAGSTTCPRAARRRPGHRGRLRSGPRSRPRALAVPARADPSPKDSGCGVNDASPNRGRPCAPPVTPSTRSAARRGPVARAASCAPRASPADAAHPTPATS
jgi:hypothetical protein